MMDAALPREFLGGRIRRLRASDLAAFQAYRSLPALGRYQGWSPMPDAEARRFIEDMHQAPLFEPGCWVQLGIAELTADELIGDIGLYLSEDGVSGEVGFTLQPAYQGRGVATRAVGAALQLLFSLTRVTRVLGVTDERNAPSIRLLGRLGFGLVERRHVVFRDEPCTEWVHVLSRDAGQPS